MIYLWIDIFFDMKKTGLDYEEETCYAGCLATHQRAAASFTLPRVPAPGSCSCGCGNDGNRLRGTLCCCCPRQRQCLRRSGARSRSDPSFRVNNRRASIASWKVTRWIIRSHRPIFTWRRASDCVRRCRPDGMRARLLCRMVECMLEWTLPRLFFTWQSKRLARTAQLSESVS